VQKYIQKIGFILLILCASKMALNAQEMKWSNPIKLKGGANFPKVLGENSNGIFLMRYRNRFYTKSIFLERYNSDLNLDLSLYVDLKNAQILKVQMTPKGILVIKSKRNKSTKNQVITGSWLSYNLKPIGKEVILFSHQNKHPLGSNMIQLCMNDSLNQLSISMRSYLNNSTEICNYLFDLDYTLIRKKRYKLGLMQQVTLKDACINNDGVTTVYCQATDQFESTIDAILLTIKPDTILPFKFTDSTNIGSATLIYNRSNDAIQFVGFYGEPNQAGLVGAVFSNLDATQTTWNTTYRRFDPEWLKTLNTGIFNSSLIAGDFKLNICIPKSDGGLVITAEQKDVSTENYVYTVNGISQSISKSIYKFNEILILSYDKEYYTEWQHKITKNQITINDGGYFSSAAPFVSEKYIQLLYNDQFRNSGEVVQYTVYNNGKTTRQKLIKTELDYLAVIPDGAIQVSSNKIIIPTYKNRKFSILKLTYN
jgi:hypothetical protein